MNPMVIEVPSPLGLRPSGLELAPDALREAGLHERLGSPDAVRIEIPSYSSVRDQKADVLNPRGIAAVARDTADAVAGALDSGRFPVLLGGDCSIMLGPLLALRRRGRYGLAFLDGHADFQHPADEPNGEVASTGPMPRRNAGAFGEGGGAVRCIPIASLPIPPLVRPSRPPAGHGPAAGCPPLPFSSLSSSELSSPPGSLAEDISLHHNVRW